MRTAMRPAGMLSAVLLVALAQAAAAAPTYTITDLGDIGGGYVLAQDVSESGLVTGSGAASSGYMHAFLWDNGVIADLGTAGVPNVSSYGNAVNSSGQVAGYSCGSNGYNRSIVWQGGSWTVLGDLGPYGGTAQDINESGVVVGNSTAASGSSRGYIWNGVTTDLGTLGGSYTTAYAINDSSQVVGYSATSSGYTHAFLWQDGAMTDLGDLGGGHSYAEGINSLGDAAGYSYSASMQSRAVMWADGAIVDLGAGPSGVYSMARDINDSRQVIGIMWSTEIGGDHPFLWQDGVMVDLNDLLPAGSP